MSDKKNDIPRLFANRSPQWDNINISVLGEKVKAITINERQSLVDENASFEAIELKQLYDTVDIDGLNAMQDKFIQVVRDLEERIIVKVLTAHLGRKPTIEDYQKCTKVYNPLSRFMVDYNLAYDGKPLGVIVLNRNGFIFEPLEV